MGVEDTNLSYDLIAQRNNNDYTIKAYFDISSVDHIYECISNPCLHKIIYTNCVDPTGNSAIVHINFIPIIYEKVSSDNIRIKIVIN